MKTSMGALRLGLVLASVLAVTLPASAATYLPMPDSELVDQAPIVVRATVLASATHLEPIAGENRPVTLVTLQVLEAFKGSPDPTFLLRLPGGRVGDAFWWIPGSPSFTRGEEVVLMLGPHPDHPGELRLTEFGLSKFDIVSDDTGRKFAVRPAFPAGEDLLASKRAPAPAGQPAGARDAESFFAFLRSAARGEVADVGYAAPRLASTKWDNITGREPGGDDCSTGPCLLRWYWDTTASPNGVLTTTGTQSNLVDDEPKCHIDSSCDAQNATAAWAAVPATNIALSGANAGGNITATLDATSSFDGTTWTTPLGCSAGVIGLGGPTGTIRGPFTYRGDQNFYALQAGTVSMRKVTCASGYSAATFRSAFLHEVGHVLGLNHPDQGESIHSTTTPTDWSNAVMHSVIAASKPDMPQTDDVQAVTYYYGTAAVGAPPTANFTWSPRNPETGTTVTFTDTSTGSPTGWNWDFGDGSPIVTTQVATHTYSAAQTYNVTLTAGSLNGSGAISFPVTVAQGAVLPCDPHVATNLCVDSNRFKVTIHWVKPDGSNGDATAVSLTDASGYFWFFDPSNIETVVKVLNGCSIGGHYWVFAAGLTNVQATITVLDTKTSTAKTYTNPQGTAFAPIQDTAAFATCP
ncbi:MAG TPA: PKD domain-containing protein [Thermoanaerobaculia bacterium]|nr:PKD domain-containing protein [Thermoanaerobaculia bacterium]